MSLEENFFKIFDEFKQGQINTQLQDLIPKLKNILKNQNLDLFTYDKIFSLVSSLKNINPNQVGGIESTQFVTVIQEILNNVVLRKNPNVPIQIKANWYDNIPEQNPNSLGICILGGGEAAQVWSVAVYNILFNLGMLDKKFVDAIVNISGAAWGGPISCYERYSVDGQNQTPFQLFELFTKYLEPEEITLNDLLYAKSKKELINNASNPLRPLSLGISFLETIFDPNVPNDLVISDGYSKNCLEQFGMYSTKSIMVKDKKDLQNVDPKIFELIDTIYVLRENFPECICMTGSYVPVVSGLQSSEYTYFPLAMTSETDGVVTKHAVVSGDNFDSFEIGGAISNYASGGQLLENYGNKNILVEMKSVYHMMSLNQMIGNASSAGINEFNNVPILNIFSHKILLNSEKTVPNQLTFTYDIGINYDLAGISYLLSKKYKHIICYVTCGEQLIVFDNNANDPRNVVPFVLLDIFARTDIDSGIYNKSPMLRLEDYDETILGIYNSPNGIFRKKYITPLSEINGIEPYEVEITFVYLKVNEWLNKLDPVCKFFLTLGIPRWPFTNNIFERVTIFPIQANAYLYYLGYQFKEFLADYIKKIRQ
jgi:hypothetical protein